MLQVNGLLLMHESYCEVTVAVVMKYMESRGSTTLISSIFDKGTMTAVRVVMKKLVSVHKNEMGNKRETEC